MVVQVGDWMEREGRVGSLGFGGLGLGGVCVRARALERREKFHGGRVRRSRHFCILAPGSDIQTGRRRHLRRCRFRKDSRPPSVRVLVRLHPSLSRLRFFRVVIHMVTSPEGEFNWESDTDTIPMAMLRGLWSMPICHPYGP